MTTHSTLTHSEIRIIQATCNKLSLEIESVTGISPCHTEDIYGDLMLQAIKLAQHYKPGKMKRSTYICKMLRMKKNSYLSSLYADKRAELQHRADAEEIRLFIQSSPFVTHNNIHVLTDIHLTFQSLSRIERLLVAELLNGVAEKDSSLGISEWQYRQVKRRLKEKFGVFLNFPR